MIYNLCSFALLLPTLAGTGTAASQSGISLVPVRLLRRDKLKQGGSGKSLKVAVVGAGTAGTSAVYFLKKHYGSRFNVELFEQDEKVGGVMTSTQWGSTSDWNEGMVDSGMVVSTRSLYPNFFDCLDSEGIRTIKRKMDLQLNSADIPEGGFRGTKFKEDFRALHTSMLQFKGTIDDFFAANSNTTNVAMRWFMRGEREMTKANFAFMTLDTNSQAGHVANTIAFLNMTGEGQYEAPVGGYFRYSEKAAGYADKLHLRAKVTRVKLEGPSGPATITWEEGNASKSATFDAVILTMPPEQLLEIQPKETVSLPHDKLSHTTTISVHKHQLGSVNAFYEWHNNGGPDGNGDDPNVNIHPRGTSPPHVTFFSHECDENCRRKYVPASEVITEYTHYQWMEDKTRRGPIAELLKNSGKGGVHFAGVWTSDGRFAEGAFVTGMRAAMEIAGEDPESFKFPSACARRAFQRYALWFRGGRYTNLESLPLLPSCFDLSGEVPSYYDSHKEYVDFYRTFTASLDQTI